MGGGLRLPGKVSLCIFSIECPLIIFLFFIFFISCYIRVLCVVSFYMCVRFLSVLVYFNFPVLFHSIFIRVPEGKSLLLCISAICNFLIDAILCNSCISSFFYRICHRNTYLFVIECCIHVGLFN